MVSKQNKDIAKTILGKSVSKAINILECEVTSAGKDKNGLAFVSVVTANTGFGSSWEVWAFEIALQALIHDRKLLVVCNGDPVGTNLLAVTLLKEKV